MPTVITIPCELMIVTGDQPSTQPRIKLTAFKEVVCDDYEDHLDRSDLETARKIVKAYAKRLDAWAGAESPA